MHAHAQCEREHGWTGIEFGVDMQKVRPEVREATRSSVSFCPREQCVGSNERSEGRAQRNTLLENMRVLSRAGRRGRGRRRNQNLKF